MGFQRILVAYDGSEISKRAMQKAIDISSPESKIEILHVYEYPNMIVGEAYVAMPAQVQNNYYQAAEAVIEEVKKQTAVLPNVEAVLKEGPPARTILSYAEESGSDLVVIGSRGLGGFKELVLGSVSHHVVQHADIPVLVIK